MNLTHLELAISCSTGVSKNADIRNLILTEGKELEISPNAVRLLFQESDGGLLPLVVFLYSAQAWSLLCLAVWKRFDPGLCSLCDSVRAAVLGQACALSGPEKGRSVAILHLLIILLVSNSL